MSSSDGGTVLRSISPAATPEEIAEGFLQAIPVDEYPYLREMVVDYAMASAQDESADFAFGLDLILDGLERLLERPLS